MTDNRSLDERYFDWLYKKVSPISIRNPARSHFLLCEQMFKKKFEWYIRNDDNRAEDARELRLDFIHEMNVRDADGMWMDLEASLLEVIIALANRCSFQADEAPREWIWNILINLDLRQFTDDVYMEERAHNAVEEILDRVINRTYSPSGHGGMFPLAHAREDQTQVELWYQMSAYLLEKIV